jgi:hypothetical protein
MHRLLTSSSGVTCDEYLVHVKMKAWNSSRNYQENMMTEATEGPLEKAAEDGLGTLLDVLADLAEDAAEAADDVDAEADGALAARDSLALR